MLAYVNGEYVPADRPVLAVSDRSFLYGDGLFETVRITNGLPFLWREHIDRLERGAAFLRIPFSAKGEELNQVALHLLKENRISEGVVRIHLSRGSSERGYSIRAAKTPTIVMATHQSTRAAHPALKVITSTVRLLADDPMAQFKTANRLSSILAREEADAVGADEAILLNHRNEVAEASAANVFCIRGDKLLTPPLSSGALAGTTRAYILSMAFGHGLNAEERPLTLESLQNSNAVFLTSAHWLVAPVTSLDGRAICALTASEPAPPHPAVASLCRACEEAAAAGR